MMRMISAILVLLVGGMIQIHTTPAVHAAATVKAAKSSGSVIEVNGVKYTRGEFDAEVNKRLASLKGQVLPERLRQIEPEVKKQVVDDFVIRTLLTQEVKRQKLTATEGEVREAMERLKTSLPPGGTLEDLLQRTGMTNETLQEEISLGIRINKLVLSQPQAKAKPSEKDINKYYQDNKERFKAPETVHARHILIAKKPGDDDKTKTEKRAKAEKLRKQLLDGADFSAVAAKNSDDSTKNSGGDLGTFTRGQMVKPFEDAAFNQKVNAIGNVVETDFGYHIIQVLAHNDTKPISLDKSTKEKISLFLQEQKKQDAFADMVKKLRAKATIIISENR